MTRRTARAAAAVLVVLAALAALTATARACLWDYDTLETERKGLPDVLEILTGRFERNPPLWYEMRLARAEKRVASDADDLAAYDDAGVACDRLGRGADGLRWMERKSARLRALEDRAPPEHDYRWLANEGTIRFHEWMRTGADRARIDEAFQAKDAIAAAIRLNPDAHFGRETVQLRAMEWVIAQVLDETPPAADEDVADMLGRPLRGGRGAAASPAVSPDDSVRGLSGLVALGAAWESVDVFHAIANAAAEDRRASVAAVAALRRDELVRAGRRSFAAGAPAGEELLQRFRRSSPGSQPWSEASGQITAWFAAARAANDAWAKARDDFILARLRAGRHPDTDPAFWDGWDDDVHPMPTPPGGSWWERTLAAVGLGHPQTGPVVGVAYLLVLAVAIVVFVRRRRRRREPRA